MGIMYSGHLWQLGSIASLATETTGGEILVAFRPKHGLRSSLRVPNLNFFSWRSMPPHPPSLFPLKGTQWPYHSRLVGSSPALIRVIIVCTMLFCRELKTNKLLHLTGWPIIVEGRHMNVIYQVGVWWLCDTAPILYYSTIASLCFLQIS